jgi:hypothetical protein
MGGVRGFTSAALASGKPFAAPILQAIVYLDGIARGQGAEAMEPMLASILVPLSGVLPVVFVEWQAALREWALWRTDP